METKSGIRAGAFPFGGTFFGDRELIGVSAGRAFFFDTRAFSGGLWILEEAGELTELFDAGVYAQSAFQHDGRLFFLAQDSEHDFQLWTSDGTATGTEVVRDDLAHFSRVSRPLQ